jgi:hypothetical protein
LTPVAAVVAKDFMPVLAGIPSTRPVEAVSIDILEQCVGQPISEK